MRWGSDGQWAARYPVGQEFFLFDGVTRVTITDIDTQTCVYLVRVHESPMYAAHDGHMTEYFIDDAMQVAREQEARESPAVLPRPAGRHRRRGTSRDAVGWLGDGTGEGRVLDRRRSRAANRPVRQRGAQQAPEPERRGSRAWSGASPGRWVMRVLGVVMMVMGACVVLWALQVSAGPTGTAVVWGFGVVGLAAFTLGLALVMEKPADKTAGNTRQDNRRR